MKYFVFYVALIQVSLTYAQDFNVSGKIFDLNTEKPLYAVQIVAFPTNDTLTKKGSVTDENGEFQIENLQKEKYIFRIDYFGYETIEFTVDIESSMELGVIYISEDFNLMDEITIAGRQIRVQQKGDTTAYNADAFKTNLDASVEELITKMPGITIENGKLKAHGEDVQRVLIDGEEFFGEDAMLAVKSLPAEIVHQIEVFDRQSDQAQFTGFDDGEEYKTLNIVTKPEKNSGQFGKMYAGYGTDDRYSAGGNINFFNGSRKISVIGISNNINQQNFENEDILGVLGEDGGGRRGRGQANNFMVGQQRGITTTHSLGLNYADKWGDNTKVSGSYFFNQSRNENESQINREYITSENETNQRYFEENTSSSLNNNHRLNFRLEHDIDSNNSLIFTPRLSLQQNNSEKIAEARTQKAPNELLNTLVNDNSNENIGFDFNGNLLYQHKFKKEGRTFSTRFTGGYNQRNGQQFQYSLSEFFSDNVDSISLVDQIGNNNTDGYNIGTDLSVTEKIGKSSMLQLNYSPTYSQNNADRTTFAIDPMTGLYTEIDTLLSSVFDNINWTQRVGASYRFGNQKMNFQFRMNFQNRVLLNDQTLPTERDVRLVFNNFLPMASFRYKFSKTKNVRLFYRTNTNTPSVNQLQDVVDNSNPLRLRSGNAALEQEYDHRLVLRYSATNPKNATNFSVYLRGEYKSDYITNATIIANADTVLQDNVILREGAQYTRPVNLDGAWNVRTYASYGRPFDLIKSNLNFNLGGS